MRTEPLCDAIEKWGASIQLIMCIEEMSELTKEISKYFRGKDNKKDLIEEMGDVYIMLEQMKIIFDVQEKELHDSIENKIKNLEIRLKE
jgi:NTP pyrophosphatase (non-canonical NTP hydrolase)